jgi:hypothetical protein
VPGAGLLELDYQSQPVTALRTKILAQAAVPEAEAGLISEITGQADRIETDLERFFDRCRIEVAHVRNLMSLPYLHPAATVAVSRLVNRRPDIRFVLHHHDFYWEGPMAKHFVTPYPA